VDQVRQDPLDQAAWKPPNTIPLAVGACGTTADAARRPPMIPFDCFKCMSTTVGGIEEVFDQNPQDK
jgi:hypothetical protein